MYRFTDADGRAWSLDVTKAAIDRCHQAGFDLQGVATSGARPSLLRNRVFLAELAYAAMRPQAAVTEVTLDSFLASISDPSVFENIADEFIASVKVHGSDVPGTYLRAVPDLKHIGM